MPPRRKINLAAVHASIANRNPDDANPWFVVRYQAPPMEREIRLAWPDGATSSGSLTASGWHVPLWHSDKPPRTAPPVGWKPLGIGASHGVGNETRAPLPDPLHYGICVT